MVSQQNSPVDIGKEQIAPYRAKVESELLTKFPYDGKDRNLADLIRQIDVDEPQVMTPLETTAYITLREGMQIFKAVSTLLGDKTGLPLKLSQNQPDKGKYREFCYGFAAYVASKYISKRMDTALKLDADSNVAHDKPDLSNITLNLNQPDSVVMQHIMVPVYANLLKQIEKRDVFKTAFEFPMYVKEVFEKQAELAKELKGKYPELETHVHGYRFRVMDEAVVLEGFEDKSIPTISAVEQKASFRPIKSSEIVGNNQAKRKITRYMERLALYDVNEKKNPVIEMGGLSWSNMFDGLPGTGKSSLFRMAMTILSERAAQTGIKYNIFTVDSSIKDEYYGKSGKILLERLSTTKDNTALTIGIFDDLDLLTSKRSDASGADNDINSIIMQYMDGVFTQRLGNVINFAATNKPTGLDDALRNRFNDRILIDGPVSAEDFADLIMLECKDLLKKNLIKIKEGYTPFATQDVRKKDGGWTENNVSGYMAEELARHKNASVLEFGKFMSDLKAKNPKITGRSAKAIIESIKERSANFDIPQSWFEKKEEFTSQTYERKVKMLSELYAPITPDILFQEAQRYFDSEQRYASTEGEEEVTSGYNSRMWSLQSDIRLLEDQIKKGQSSDMVKLQSLQTEKAAIESKASQTIIDAIRNATEAEAKNKK